MWPSGSRGTPAGLGVHVGQEVTLVLLLLGAILLIVIGPFVFVRKAHELATQTDDTELATAFGPIASALADASDTIEAELLAVQGKPADIGGYYHPDGEKAAAVMRPSHTFNEILATLS